MQLTERQQAVLDFIRFFRQDRGCFPSLREMQEHFGLASPNGINKHLIALEKKGVLQRSGGLARNLVLREENTPAVLQIPLLGAIPAGMPFAQTQQHERCIAVDTETIALPKSARTFALEVRGDSMVLAGIHDRDIVIMELAPPKHQDIVAALIDGDTTLKRYLVQKGKPFLRAEHPDYPDLIPARELVIQGVFRALIRLGRSAESPWPYSAR